MKIYERDGQYLVIFGDIPQWLIVDQLGLEVIKGILSGKRLEQISAELPETKDRGIKATYRQILPLITPRSAEQIITAGNSLTSRTTVAMISVTGQCNLYRVCPHCYVDAGNYREELKLAEHQFLANQLYSCLSVNPRQVYKVNLTGGEPFCRADIMAVIAAYKAAGFMVNMSTNAMLIRQKQIPALAEMAVALGVSLDGASSATHDLIRGTGAFAKVINQIKRLVDAGIRVGINCLLHAGNFAELEQLIDLAHLLGVNGFNPINLVQLGRACGSKLKRVSETEAFRRIAVHLRQHPEQQYLFAATSLFSSLGAGLLSGIICESCGVGDRPCVYIDQRGDVFPCPNTQRTEFLLGNIRRQLLAECVSVKQPVLVKFRELKVSALNPVCSACDVRYFCGGDCRGETYNVTGDLKAPYVACADRHDSIIELMWIVAENPGLFEARADEYIANLC